MRQSVKIFMLFARAGKCICDKYKDELLNVMTPPTTYPKINEKGDQMINLHHTTEYGAYLIYSCTLECDLAPEHF